MEAKSAREALSRAIEDFKNSEEFKGEILEGGFVSYCVGYADGRDAVKKLHPDLDLSSIVPPGSEDGAAEEKALLTQAGTPIVPEVVQISNATSGQRDKDSNES